MQQRSPALKPKLIKPVLIALAIHLGLFALLFVSYSKEHELPPSRPVVKAKLYQLESKNQAEKHSAQKITGDAEKTTAKQHEREQLEQKKRLQQEQQRKQAEQKAAEQKRQQQLAAEKKKQEEQAQAKRKQEQEKALAAKKRAQEKEQAEKAAAEKKRQQQLAAEKKKQEEQAKRLAEEAKRRAEEEKQAAALAEMLSEQTRYQREIADRQAAEDVGRISDLMVDLIASNWIRPAGTRNGMLVELVVEFSPEGHIKSANVSKSSGFAAYDNSALAAVRSVSRVQQIQQLDRATYEKHFRQVKMVFKPEDLEL